MSLPASFPRPNYDLVSKESRYRDECLSILRTLRTSLKLPFMETYQKALREGTAKKISPQTDGISRAHFLKVVLKTLEKDLCPLLSKAIKDGLLNLEEEPFIAMPPLEQLVEYWLEPSVFYQWTAFRGERDLAISRYNDLAKKVGWAQTPDYVPTSLRYTTGTGTLGARAMGPRPGLTTTLPPGTLTATVPTTTTTTMPSTSGLPGLSTTSSSTSLPSSSSSSSSSSLGGSATIPIVQPTPSRGYIPSGAFRPYGGRALRSLGSGLGPAGGTDAQRSLFRGRRSPSFALQSPQQSTASGLSTIFRRSPGFPGAFSSPTDPRRGEAEVFLSPFQQREDDGAQPSDLFAFLPEPRRSRGVTFAPRGQTSQPNSDDDDDKGVEAPTNPTPVDNSQAGVLPPPPPSGVDEAASAPEPSAAATEASKSGAPATGTNTSSSTSQEPASESSSQNAPQPRTRSGAPSAYNGGSLFMMAAPAESATEKYQRRLREIKKLKFDHVTLGYTLRFFLFNLSSFMTKPEAEYFLNAWSARISSRDPYEKSLQLLPWIWLDYRVDSRWKIDIVYDVTKSFSPSYRNDMKRRAKEDLATFITRLQKLFRQLHNEGIVSADATQYEIARRCVSPVEIQHIETMQEERRRRGIAPTRTLDELKHLILKANSRVLTDWDPKMILAPAEQDSSRRPPRKERAKLSTKKTKSRWPRDIPADAQLQVVEKKRPGPAPKRSGPAPKRSGPAPKDTAKENRAPHGKSSEPCAYCKRFGKVDKPNHSLQVCRNRVRDLEKGLNADWCPPRSGNPRTPSNSDQLKGNTASRSSRTTGAAFTGANAIAIKKPAPWKKERKDPAVTALIATQRWTRKDIGLQDRHGS